MLQAQIGFSSFSVNDLAKAKEFYTNTLGLTVNEQEMGLDVQLPNGGKLFVYPKADHQPATFTVVHFVVENVDQTVGDLKAAGVQFEQYDLPEFHTDEKGIARGKEAGHGPDIAWFKDPAGNIFAVLQN